jgi:hypothetical protein
MIAILFEISPECHSLHNVVSELLLSYQVIADSIEWWWNLERKNQIIQLDSGYLLDKFFWGPNEKLEESIRKSNLIQVIWYPWKKSS